MSNTNRRFNGKEYRQGHEPCELDLTRKRAKRKANSDEAHGKNAIQRALRQAALDEQDLMGYADR